MNPQEVLNFWFQEAGPGAWWAKSAEFDDRIRRRFGALHHSACLGELYPWRETPEGRLAEVIVLDQFSRNLFRDSARAFAQDGQALVLAQEAVSCGADLALELDKRCFFYMPYMHSESLVIHAVAERLFALPGLEDNARFERRHREIIERFGRYPHRNRVLGRRSTAEEEAFLRQPGSSF